MAFAAHGAAGVLIADLDLAKVQNIGEQSATLATNPSYRYLALAVDVGDAAQVRDMISKAMDLFGRINYSINCAGVCSSQEAREWL